MLKTYLFKPVGLYTMYKGCSCCALSRDLYSWVRDCETEAPHKNDLEENEMKNTIEYVYLAEVWVDGEPYRTKVFANRDRAYVWGTENALTNDKLIITEYKITQ